MKNTVLSNNVFLLKYIGRVVPATMLFMCTFGVLHTVVVFFEHTYMRKFVLDCIQFNRPFIYVVWYIAAIFVAVNIKMLIGDIFDHSRYLTDKALLLKSFRFDIYKKASELDLTCYDNPTFYNDFVWAMKEAEKRAELQLQTIDQLGRGLASLLTSGVLMAANDGVGFIFVAAVFGLSFFINIKMKDQNFKLQNDLLPQQRRRDYIHRVLYLSDYAKELRLHPIKGKLDQEYTKSNDSLITVYKKHTPLLTALSFIDDFVVNFCILEFMYILYLLYRTVVLNDLSYGAMVALSSAVWGLKHGFSTLTKIYPVMREHSLYIEKIRKFLSYEPAIKSKADACPMPKETAGFVFDKVNFSYNGEPILKDISFRVKPGEKIAIVGYNGAGKTTLIKLLLRLYDPQSGTILYDGKNIADYDLQAYRDHFGVVFQDYQLYSTTLAQNVTCDRTEGDNEKVIDALEKSGFGEKLKSLKDGAKTVITKEFDENGTSLSGGEAQKVAISRILYKDSRVIVLDEPSSALDPISEYELNRMFVDFSDDKTVFIISHRLSTTRMADRIFVISDGQIIESGNHDELLALNGAYAEMFTMQSEKYRSAMIG